MGNEEEKIENVIVENTDRKSIFGKGLVLRLIISLLVAILSFGVVGKITSNPETYKKYIDTLDKKQKNVLVLSASTAGVATLISVIGGDRGQAISNKLFDVTGYFLVILCAIMLEKYLASLLGLVALKIIVPLACLLYMISVFRKNKTIKQFAIKLCIVAISMVLIIPGSIELSNFIDSVYKINIEQTVQEAKNIQNDIKIIQNEEIQKNETSDIKEIENNELEEKKNGLRNIVDSAKNVFDNATNKVAIGAKTLGEKVVSGVKTIASGITTMLDKSVDYFNMVVETIAIMIVTSCVIPIVVILIYLWLVKIFFNIDFQISYKKIPKLSMAAK